MRRTLGYFIAHKFGTPSVVQKLAEYGFAEGAYKKVVVTWDWTPDAKAAADVEGILLWDFRQLMRDIARSIRDARSYFTDDTLRTINLFARALADAESDIRPSKNGRSKATEKAVVLDRSAPYWVYRNWVDQRARMHRGSCSCCNNGIGAQGSSGKITGEWKSFANEEDAKAYMVSSGYDDAGPCSVCMKV